MSQVTRKRIAGNRNGLSATACVAIAFLTILAGCRKKREEPVKEVAPEIVATVGSTQITIEEYRREVERRHAQRHAVQDPEAILQEMIDDEALVQRAIELGVARDPEVERVYRNLLVGRLRERKLEPDLRKLEVTDEEIHAYYERNLKQYAVPAKVRLAILYRKVNARNAERIVEALKQAKAKAVELPPDTVGFGPLAIHNTEHQASRYRGGDIGWITVGRKHPTWPDSVLMQGCDLAGPGDISDVIKTGDGAFLVRLIARKNERTKPVEDVKQAIRATLLTRKRQAVETSFRQRMREGIEVRLSLENLDKAVSPYRQERPAPREAPPPSLP